MVVLHILRQHIRAAADGLRDEAVDAHGFKIRLGQDGRAALGQQVQHDGIRLLADDLHGVLVDHDGLLHRGEVGVVRAGLVVDNAVDRERDVLGGDGRAVMEHGVLTQLEFPGDLVLQQLVAGGEVEHELAGVVLLHKVAVDVLQHGRGGAGVQHLRIRRLDVGVGGDDQRAAVLVLCGLAGRRAVGGRRAGAGSRRTAGGRGVIAARGQQAREHHNRHQQRKAGTQFLHTFFSSFLIWGFPLQKSPRKYISIRLDQAARRRDGRSPRNRPNSMDFAP